MDGFSLVEGLEGGLGVFFGGRSMPRAANYAFVVLAGLPAELLTSWIFVNIQDA